MSHVPGESQGSDQNMSLGQGQEGHAVDDQPLEGGLVSDSTPPTPSDGFVSDADSTKGVGFGDELVDHNELDDQPAPGLEESAQSAALLNPALPLERSPSEPLQSEPLVMVSAPKTIPIESLEGFPRLGALTAESETPTPEVVSTNETTSVEGSDPPLATVSPGEIALARTNNPLQELISPSETRPAGSTDPLLPAAPQSEAAAPEASVAPLMAVPQVAIASGERSAASSQNEPASETVPVAGSQR
jgi:hypothetical protein